MDKGHPTGQPTALVEIVINDDLTPVATARLRDLLSDALELHPAHLVVDLAGCGYADVRAVDVLLAAHRQAWHMGGRLTLRAPCQRLQRLLKLAHVEHVFNVTPAPSTEPAQSLPQANQCSAAPL